jgi:hypothetical protein
MIRFVTPVNSEAIGIVTKWFNSIWQWLQVSIKQTLQKKQLYWEHNT